MPSLFRPPDRGVGVGVANSQFPGDDRPAAPSGVEAVGVTVLKEMFDLTDEAAPDNFGFNA